MSVSVGHGAVRTGDAGLARIVLARKGMDLQERNGPVWNSAVQLVGLGAAGVEKMGRDRLREDGLDWSRRRGEAIASGWVGRRAAGMAWRRAVR